MDIAKSLPPLIYLLVPSSSNTLTKLRKTRNDLATQVTELINTLGPEMFPDFHSKRIITDPLGNDLSSPTTPLESTHSDSFSLVDSTPASPTGDGASISGGSFASGNLPRNESFKDLGRMEFYSTRPATPTKPRSRANSGGGGFGSLKALTSTNVDSKEGMEAVSEKIRGAMRERNHRRRSSGADGWEMGSGATTPGSEAGRKDI